MKACLLLSLCLLTVVLARKHKKHHHSCDAVPAGYDLYADSDGRRVGFGGSYQYRRCDIDDSKSIPPYKWRCYYSDREDSARCFVSCNYQPETEHNCLNAGRFRPTLPYCVKQNP